MALLEYLCIFIPVTFVSWQLMWFFCLEEGRVQRWRLRRALDNIAAYLEKEKEAKDTVVPQELTFYFKNKKFSIGLFKRDVEYLVYKTYDIYINGDEAARLHCLQHTFLNSYRMKTANNRHEDEIIKIILAGNKSLKKLQKETTEKKIPSWKENSYFD